MAWALKGKEKKKKKKGEKNSLSSRAKNDSVTNYKPVVNLQL